MITALAGALPLAEVSGEAAKAGPIAVLVIVVLSIACYFLFRSMSRHLRAVREQFPRGPGSAAPSVGPNGAAGAAGARDATDATDDGPQPPPGA